MDGSRNGPPAPGSPAHDLYLQLYLELGQAVVAWGFLELNVEIIAAHVFDKMGGREALNQERDADPDFDPDFPTLSARRLTLIKKRFKADPSAVQFRPEVNTILSAVHKLTKTRHFLFHGTLVAQQEFEATGIATFRKMDPDLPKPNRVTMRISLTELCRFRMDVLAAADSCRALQNALMGPISEA